MDQYVNQRDYQLLENDKYTFFVLGKIIGGNNTILLTNHENFILCYSNPPFPIWIWTADSIDENETRKVYDVVKEHGLLSNQYSFNMKYELAKYFIDEAKKDNIEIEITLDMFAYDCPSPIKPDSIQGSLYTCVQDDLDEVVDFMELFHNELDMDKQSREDYTKQAMNRIDEGSMFFWKDDKGRVVACCNIGKQDTMASIGLVYTKPEYRRNHYAQNLVYEVSQKILQDGLMPILYTDANYIASNACYEKVGYKLQGKLCTICIK